MEQDSTQVSAHGRKGRRTRVELKGGDSKKVAELLKKGRESVCVIKRAQVLQALRGGRIAAEVAETVGVAERTVRNIKNRYEEGGLQKALWDAPRPGAKRVFDSRQEQQLVAVLCGPSPSGRARWTIRTAAEAAVERGIVPKVGRETVRVLINNHELKPWREKNVVHSGVDAGVHRADGGSSGSLRKASRSERARRLSR